MTTITNEKLRTLANAALDQSRIQGLTHTFYRYPARFSPRFAAAAIELFSEPDDLVLDPFMGGGTTPVEAMVRGRSVVGTDLNELAVFVARVKTKRLGPIQCEAVLRWVETVLPKMKLNAPCFTLDEVNSDPRTRNLSLPRARPIRKALAIALEALPQLRRKAQREFAQCVLLRAAQWALNGNKSAPSLERFRTKVRETAFEMVEGHEELGAQLAALDSRPTQPLLANTPASSLPELAPFTKGARANLVVTSPPYPGVHMLYHRWQVDGRKETPAPYWITGCNDGEGATYYNFAPRRGGGIERYYEEALTNFKAIRRVVHKGCTLIQMIAFSEPDTMLPRYLAMMDMAGFDEVVDTSDGSRIWRSVPNRQWHATAKGSTSSSKELVLIHRARS